MICHWRHDLLLSWSEVRLNRDLRVETMIFLYDHVIVRRDGDILVGESLVLFEEKDTIFLSAYLLSTSSLTKGIGD